MVMSEIVSIRSLLGVMCCCGVSCLLLFFLSFFFFKQKTAYEMRISDWSADVCSSDLRGVEPVDRGVVHQLRVADRDTGPGMAGGPGFQQQHLVAWVRREPVRDDRTGRPGADHDVVIGLHAARPDRKSTRLNSSH